MGTFLAFVILVVIALLVLASCIRIVPQAPALVGKTGGISGNMVGRPSLQDAFY